MSYQYTGQRREEVTSNQNLTYDPATGDPVPFSNIAARVYPEWGYVNGEYMQGWSNWHAFVTSVTKRFSDRWQFSGNYTFGAVKDSAGTAVPDGEGERRGRRSPLRARSRSTCDRTSRASTRMPRPTSAIAPWPMASGTSDAGSS